MPTTKPLNYAATTLAADYTAGSGTLVLKAGSGSLFGSPSVDAPIRITVAGRSTLVGGQIVAGTKNTIYTVTSRSGDTLSGLTAVEGTTDQDFTRNDPVASLITAGTLEELQDALANAALPTGTEGAILVASQDAPPVFDPKLAWTDDTFVVKTGHANGRHKQVHNVTADRSSQFPWTETYETVTADGVKDHVYSRGWQVGTVATGFPSLTENWENFYAPGDVTDTNTLEMHWNYRSPDGSVAYRFENSNVRINTGDYEKQWITSKFAWYGRQGNNASTMPLMLIQTTLGDASGDGGTVTISNNGSTNPLRVNSSGNGLLLLNTGSTGGFAINNVQPSDAVNTTRSSPAIAIQGSYWNGSASVSASTTYQHVVASTSSNYLRMITGSTSHYFQSDGKVGLAIPGLVYLTEQVVASYGNYGMVRNDQGSTVKLIGLDTSNRVVVSAGGNGILFGAAFVGQLGGLLGATSGQRGILDVRGTAWFGSAGATHAILNGADGVFINVNANGTGSNLFTVASGRSTTSGGTTGLTVSSTGAVAAPVSLSVGGGSAITKILPASATLDFPEIAAGGQQELTISVTGAAVGASVAIGPPAGIESGLAVSARVSSADTVTVRLVNATASPINPASATFKATVFNP